MNEPEQNQPINPDEGQEAAGAAPVSSSSSSDQSAQPEFGQYMSNQYPANYNPYMYGAPEQPKPEDDAQQTAQRPQTNPYMQNGYPANPYDASGRQQSGQPNGYQYGPNQYGPSQYGPNPYQQPGIYPINPNDPSQNPLYGHWDSYAIISFVFALFLPVPVIPAVMGAIAMWRTKKLHMKGYALGVAALIINVLYTIAVIWMTVHGISTADLYNQMMQYMFGGSGQSGDSSSISA